MSARLGRRQLQPTIIIRTPQPPAPGAGDVNGVATASATVVGSSIDPPIPAQPLVVSVWQQAYRARFNADPAILFTAQVASGVGDVTGSATASATVVGARSDAGDVTGAATASATVVGANQDAEPAQPIIVWAGEAARRARIILDPFTLVRAPAGATPGAGDVNGAATASATIVGARADSGAVTGAATASAAVVGGTAGSGAVTGAATASATVVGLVVVGVTGAATAAATVVGNVSSPGSVLGAATASATIFGAESGGVFELVGHLSASSSRGVGVTASSRRSGPGRSG